MPARVALMALPLAFVVTQLGGAVVREAMLWFLSGRIADAEASAAAATLLAMGSTSLLLLGVAIGVPFAAGSSLRAWLPIRSAPWYVFIAAAVGTVALGPLADLLMASMAAFFPEWTLGSVPLLHDLAQRYPVLWLWPFFALLPGVAEEAFFRGMVQGAFRRPTVAIAVAGSAFALFHLDPHHVLGVLPLGLFLSWVAQHHGLGVTMFAHVFNNTVALFSAQVADLDVGYGTDTPLPFYWVPLGLCVAALAMWLLRAAESVSTGSTRSAL